MWETALKPHVPWFELEFAEEDPEAPVQVEWKRDVRGAQGWGGIRSLRLPSGRVVAGGHMQVTTRINNFNKLPIDDMRVLISHEFGHVLGLMHCLDCDSAMNYSWQTEDRVFVTQVDVDAVVRHHAAVGGAEAEEVESL